MHGIENLRERIRKGEQIVGVSAPLNATKSRLEDVFSKDSYDYVSTDSQHSPFNEETLVQFCNTANELGMPVHFRMKHTRHSYLVGNMLDLGPSIIEVPQVEEVATVEESLHYFYYRQQGGRSWGGAARVAVADHADRLDYARWWNVHGVLWMQVESLRSVTGARELARPGVACLSWGPADLSFDRERHPEHPLKTDDDCVKHVLKLLEGSDTRLCVRSYDPGLRNKYRDMGVTVLLERPKT